MLLETPVHIETCLAPRSEKLGGSFSSGWCHLPAGMRRSTRVWSGVVSAHVRAHISLTLLGFVVVMLPSSDYFVLFSVATHIILPQFAFVF